MSGLRSVGERTRTHASTRSHTSARAHTHICLDVCRVHGLGREQQQAGARVDGQQRCAEVGARTIGLCSPTAAGANTPASSNSHSSASGQ